MTTTTSDIVTVDPAEALGERFFDEGIGAVHQMTVYLGVRLGLFRALAEQAGQTIEQLAASTSLDPRYVQEWLQAETIAGLVIADSTELVSARYSLANGVAETLVDEVHPAFLGGMAMAVAALGRALPELVTAYATGDGVPMSAYGPEVVAAQAALNRPAFVNDLAANWLPQIPDVQQRLTDTAAPARVADVGCGVGWASIELAKAYPHVRVDGYDADELTIKQARENAHEHGVEDRVTFHLIDASATPYGDGEYDAVFFFECLHDLGRPVEALEAARAAVAPGGAVIVMDERTAETPQIGDPVEIFFATVSAVWCLPQSRVVADCEAPGTVMRPATLEAFTLRAGWSGFEVLPIDHPFFRFYRLTP